MSNLLIDIADARLSIMGYQPEVKRIYWSALPGKLPTFGETLDLTGCEIKAIYADGSEAVVTDYCTFSPDTGYTVPNERTLTVTATYTARSGKVCEADEVLPICTLDHIKIIIPHSVPENIKVKHIKWSFDEPPTPHEYAEQFGFDDIYVAAYWMRDGELVQVTRLSLDEALFVNDVMHNSSFLYYYSGEYVAEMSSSALFFDSQTYTRFYTPFDSEEIEYRYAIRLVAKITYSGQTYTDKAYLTADAPVAIEMKDPQMSYTGTEYFTLDGRDSSDWKLIYSESGEQPMEFYYPYINDHDPLVGLNQGPTMSVAPGSKIYTEKIDTIFQDQCWGVKVRLTDNASDKFSVGQHDLLTIIEFNCSAGAVSWTHQYATPTRQPI